MGKYGNEKYMQLLASQLNISSSNELVFGT